MNLVVYEHITSGAMSDEHLPPSLQHEGQMMLHAIVQDLLALGQIQITVLQDERLDLPAWMKFSPDLKMVISASFQQFQHNWQQCLQWNDYFLLIAPETNNILLKLQQQVLEAGKRYLGCTVPATELSSHKLLCYQTLKQAGIPTAETFTVSQVLLDPNLIDQAYVVKPIDGAGCLNTVKLNSAQQTRDYLMTVPPGMHHNLVVQPFIKGIVMSLSVYLHEDKLQLLSINKQIIEQHGQQFIFKGCKVNYHTAQFNQQHAQQLAGQIHQAISGLSGYVGIDFVLGEAAVTVLEINPRLTTAYVYLDRHGEYNPALPLWQQLLHLNQQEAHYA